MPNRKAHAAAGAGSGLVVACNDLPRLTPAEQLVYLAGAALGGAVGGCLPDILEPATSPNHRQACHGVVPVGTVAIFIRNTLPTAAKELLQRAEWVKGSNPKHAGMTLERMAWLFAAGFVKGLGPGYLSHLVLDSCTPRGLPLFGKIC
jgi:hypothetical protein